MEAILLGIYAFFVWLIFIKLKLLPWTTPWKVGVAIFPVIAMAALLLLLGARAGELRGQLLDVRFGLLEVEPVAGARRCELGILRDALAREIERRRQ